MYTELEKLNKFAYDMFIYDMKNKYRISYLTIYEFIENKEIYHNYYDKAKKLIRKEKLNKICTQT